MGAVDPQPQPLDPLTAPTARTPDPCVVCDLHLGDLRAAVEAYARACREAAQAATAAREAIAAH